MLFIARFIQKTTLHIIMIILNLKSFCCVPISLLSSLLFLSHKQGALLKLGTASTIVWCHAAFVYTVVDFILFAFKKVNTSKSIYIAIFQMFLKMNGTLLWNTFRLYKESFHSINGIFVRHFNESSIVLGRTQWSMTRIKKPNMRIPVPRRLLDGKYYRNQSKSGRGEDGRIKIRHKGGGHSRNFRIVDTIRVPLHAEEEETKVYKDRILHIGYDPFRSAHIALVAGNGSNQRKLILCPHETKVGDILTASRGKPESLARMIPGDAYPLQYLPLGTMVHSIEKVPGEGGAYCRAAGMYAILTHKDQNQAVLKCQNKRRAMLTVDVNSLAVIGRASNIGKKHEIIGKAGRSRWLNRKPKGQTGKDRWHHRKKVR